MGIDLQFGSEKKDPAKGEGVAVALESGTDGALPKIVASGRGALAEQILKLAFENNIKVRQDADLAELLASLDLDHEIPPEAIVAVAEILARVFEANAAAVAQQPSVTGPS
jgi:flagellar biosynthesis protein